MMMMMMMMMKKKRRRRRRRVSVWVSLISSTSSRVNSSVLGNGLMQVCRTETSPRGLWPSQKTNQKRQTVATFIQSIKSGYTSMPYYVPRLVWPMMLYEVPSSIAESLSREDHQPSPEKIARSATQFLQRKPLVARAISFNSRCPRCGGVQDSQDKTGPHPQIFC